VVGSGGLREKLISIKNMQGTIVSVDIEAATSYLEALAKIRYD
jgi:hypothetical protein